MTERRYRHPLPPVRERGFWLEFPEAPSAEVRCQLGNCSWRYANRRWWYRGPLDDDGAIVDLRRTLARYGEVLDDYEPDWGRV